jgi:hypothetical protein
VRSGYLRGNRRGMALALTLWVLVIGAAVLTVAVFLGFQEQRAAGAGRRLHRTLTRAESALAGVLSGWTPGVLSRRLPQPFDSVLINGTGTTADDSWAGAIHRLGRDLFLVELTAADAPGAGAPQTLATRARLGLLVHARPVQVVVSAALSSGGPAIVGTGSTIDGRDQTPPDRADCPPPDSAVPGVVAGAITEVGTPRIDGSPPTVTRQAGDTGLAAEDQVAFDQLASQATITVPGGSWGTWPISSGSDCDVASLYNWGDGSKSDGQCSSYLPIVHVTGDLTLTAGQGQGILLVDGNLWISGGYRYFGLVMVRGTFDAGGVGAGSTVWGGVAAARIAAEARPLTGIGVMYSKCMISHALRTSGTLVPLRSRAWKQLF